MCESGTPLAKVDFVDSDSFPPVSNTSKQS